MSARLHSTTYQKTLLFIVTTMGTSNLINIFNCSGQTYFRYRFRYYEFYNLIFVLHHHPCFPFFSMVSFTQNVMRMTCYENDKSNIITKFIYPMSENVCNLTFIKQNIYSENGMEEFPFVVTSYLVNVCENCSVQYCHIGDISDNHSLRFVFYI
jgi:hypothetical protein